MAFVFRTHAEQNFAVDSRQVLDYVEQLAGSGYALAVLLNVPDASTPSKDLIRRWIGFLVAKAPSVPLLAFRDDEVHRRHPEYAGAWFHAQQALLAAYERLAERSRHYDRYWFIENDARYGGPIRDLIESHDRAMPETDLLGMMLGRYEESREWPMWTMKPQRMPAVPMESRRRFFAAVCRLSARLLARLATHIHDQQTHLMAEMYLPTVCAVEFGESAVRDLDPKFWTLATIRYRPVHGTDADWRGGMAATEACRGKIMHPIKAVA